MTPRPPAWSTLPWSWPVSDFPPADHGATRLEILPVTGMPDLRPGDDLVAAVADAAPQLQDGDVLVVTSKVVSKIEGRLITLPTADADVREQARREAVDEESVRVVATRGDLRIVQNRQGLVLAAAGVDSSNVARNELALLPVDPDASAARLREGLRAKLGVDVAVIVSDSMGRPWRTGITDAAIGVAGLSAVFDARGQLDAHGNLLEVTQVAVADEIAAAADLVKGKLRGVPVAIARGLAVNGKLPDDGLGQRDAHPQSGGGHVPAGHGRGDRCGSNGGRRPDRRATTAARGCCRRRGDVRRRNGSRSVRTAGIPRFPRRPPGCDVALLRARPPNGQCAGARSGPTIGAAHAPPSPGTVVAARRAL